MNVYPSVVSLIMLSLHLVHAQTSSDPVGIVKNVVSPNALLYLSAPLHRSLDYEGEIQTISGSTITVSGTPAWSTNRFVKVTGTQEDTFYVRIDSGSKEGLFAKIISNTSNTLTLSFENEETLADVLSTQENGQGDLISIFAAWTPSTVLPNPPAGTELHVFPNDVAAISLPYQTLIFDGTNWMEGTNNANHLPLKFGVGFAVKNNTSNPLPVTNTGNVPMVAQRVILRTLASDLMQEHYISFNSPVPVKIRDAITGTSLFDTFNRSYIPGQTRPSILWGRDTNNEFRWIIYGWGQPEVADFTVTLEPGESFQYYKMATPEPETVIQKFMPPYLENEP